MAIKQGSTFCRPLKFYLKKVLTNEIERAIIKAQKTKGAKTNEQLKLEKRKTYDEAIS